MSTKRPPLVSLDELEPNPRLSPLAPDFLGFTLSSWRELIAAKGPVMMAEVGGHEQLLLCSHETDRRAWKAPDDWLYGPPTSSGNFFNREMGHTHITQQDGPVHRRSRKLLLPGFGALSMGQNIAEIGRTLDTGLDRLHDKSARQPIDLHAELCMIYTRALSRSQVKVSLDDIQLKQLNEFEEQFISGLQLSAEDQLRWHGRPEYLTLKSSAFKLFEQIASDRLGGETETDTLQSLMDNEAGEDIAPLKSDELHNLIYLLLVAGVGNIAVLACCMIFSLGKRPDWQEELREELAGFVPEQMKRGMKAFPKLQATVFETERCFLPAPVVPKVTTRDLDVLGFHVPANTHVLQMIGMSHFDASRYPDPESFQPERWLEGRTVNGPAARANAYGGGTHLCLGMGVSRALLPLTLALVSTRHTFESVEEPIHAPVDPELDYSPMAARMQAVLGKL